MSHRSDEEDFADEDEFKCLPCESTFRTEAQLNEHKSTRYLS